MREANVQAGEKWHAEFDQYGGYDCMSPGWHIKQGDRTLFTIDYADLDWDGEDPAPIAAAIKDAIIANHDGMAVLREALEKRDALLVEYMVANEELEATGKALRDDWHNDAKRKAEGLAVKRANAAFESIRDHVAALTQHPHNAQGVSHE